MTRTEMPMTVADAIRSRRSVRNYRAERLDAATIEALLAAAVRAPTAIHMEPWGFLVIQEMLLLHRISDRAKGLFMAEARREHLDRGGHDLDVFESPDFSVFYNAGTLIAICATRGGPFAPADCWLAAENLILTATAMGLGTCVIGSAVEGLNAPDIRAEIGLPEDAQVVAPIIVGVPADAAPPTSRRQPRILNWLGR
ncbi:MAG: putative nitroreductase [Rhodocyclaceae bacterium]|nr:putative nitroreductase [Rhodocyclaceae bacterium]